MKRNLIFKLTVFVLCVAVLAVNIAIRPDIFMAAPQQVQAGAKQQPKYVFYLIGDGMGQAQRTLATLAKNNTSVPKGKEMSPLVMDSFPVWGMNTTQSYDSLVTDSAAAGTALASGVKTDNKSIGQTPDGKRLKTLLEAARDKGMSTGLVTTTRITHATPAAFFAHIDHRDKEADIANQMVDSGVDVFFGGGDRFLQPQSVKGSKRKDDRNIYNELAAKGYAVLNTNDEFHSFDAAKTSGLDKVIGIYANSHLTWEIDRNPAKEPSLAEMAAKAINILSENPKGFFVMIEGGRIDHAAHQHDSAGIVQDTLAFDAAVKEAYDFYLKHPNETLIIVTADHETGGLGIGTLNDYFVNPTVVNNVNSTMEKIGQAFAKHNDENKLWNDFFSASGIAYNSLTDAERASVEKAIADTRAGVVPWNENIASETLVGSALTEIINGRAHIGFTTYAHTGSAVPLTAIGVGAQDFGRLLDNTEVAKALAALMKITL